MASNLILAKFRKLATKTGYTTIKCEDIKELIDAIDSSGLKVCDRCRLWVRSTDVKYGVCAKCRES